MQNSTEGDVTERTNPASVVSEKKMTLRAEFYYLLTLNEILLQHFLLIFIIKEANSMHEIRNNKIF